MHLNWANIFLRIAASVALTSWAFELAQSFTPSGTFDNPGTKEGTVTLYSGEGEQRKLDKETPSERGVELVYKPGATTSECTKIASIQIVWLTDDKGKVRSFKDASTRPANFEQLDKAAADGYVVDFSDAESTPYYQDIGGGKFAPDQIGSSDGKGGGTPAHTTDKPTPPNDAGWVKHFEVWTVCIEGHDAGTVLAGALWEVDNTTKKAKITNKNPAAPTDHFKDALKSWEKWYNDAHGAAPYNEPGGGFKF